MRRANGQFLKGTHWRPEAPHWNKEWLSAQYATLGRSCNEIASEIGITEAAILYWLRKHGIPRRTISEARDVKHWGAKGEKNGAWGMFDEQSATYIDGRTPDRQREYARSCGRMFLATVRDRDGHKCRKCDSSGSGTRNLDVHHIVAWDSDPSKRLDADNAVTLCAACHRWVHSNANTEKEFLK